MKEEYGYINSALINLQCLRNELRDLNSEYIDFRYKQLMDSFSLLQIAVEHIRKKELIN